MIKGWLIFCFLCVLCDLCGVNHSNELQLAQAYYSAKDYPAAILIYQNLLKKDLSGWERSVIAYNLGTALTAQGDHPKAIETLKMVPLDKDTSPVLAFRLQQNLTTANFRQGEKLDGAIQTQSLSSQDSYLKALYYFKKTLEGVAATQKSECDLLQTVGDVEVCPKDSNLDTLDALSKVGIAHMRKEARQHLVSHADLQQGLPWLSTGLQQIGKDINFMLEMNVPSSLKNSYQQLFYEHALSWKPLWQALEQKLNDKQLTSSFEKAEADFNLLLGSLEKGDFKNAKTNLTATTEGLDNLMHLVFSADPFQKIISTLLSDFSVAALQEPLETNTLIFLQQKLNEISLPKEHEVLKDGMEAVKGNLEHSLAALQKHQDLLSEVYFNESWQQIRRLLLLLNPAIQESPDIILKAGISEQQHAMVQTRLLASFLKAPQAASAIVLASQEYPLAFAEFFYNSAYARQRKEFTSNVPEGGEDTRCQYHPWNEVFPLFQQGINTMERIVKVLKISPVDLNVVMQEQEKGLTYWNEALAKLQEPKKSGGCYASVQSQAAAESFDETARLVQQMNSEDQRPAVPSAAVKEGLKPW